MLDTARAWVPRFLAHLALERRLSPHTDAGYRRDLARFIAYCEHHALPDWQRVDSQHVRTFAAAEFRRGTAPRTIQRRLSALRSFFAFLMREGALRANPALDVRAPKAGKRLPDTLDVDLMTRLLELDCDAALAVRDRAIMELFYSCGLRLAELVGLNLGDLDLPDRTVRVHGKGRKDRVVPVGRHALAAIERWQVQRSALAPAGEQALFVGSRGQRLTARAIQKRVAFWAQRQGLGRHVHPHLFRHSFATHLLESSRNLRGVQELLGHASIATTQVYTHLDFQHLAKIYDAAHPRARRKRQAR